MAAFDCSRPEVRRNAAAFLLFMGTNAQPAFPALQALRNDPSARVREAASVTLQRVASRVISFDRPLSGEFGADAKIAMPALLKSLSAPDTRMREQATDTLLKIDPEAAAKAGVK